MFSDQKGTVLKPITSASEDEIAQYERAINYLKQSEDGAELISRIGSSKEVFIVVFNNRHTDSLEPHPGVYYINYDPYSGVVLKDGISTQSSALGLAHELGHAAQILEGYYYNMTYDEREEDCIRLFETPIANQLGEPTRNNNDKISLRRMNNSTHYTTCEEQSRPWWHYVCLWKLFTPNYVPIEHNTK